MATTFSYRTISREDFVYALREAVMWPGDWESWAPKLGIRVDIMADYAHARKGFRLRSYSKFWDLDYSEDYDGTISTRVEDSLNKLTTDKLRDMENGK